ncbi:hypothetical protein [Thiolapillus sp.]|uniref:hypothetical protein n=1 Tax=Thiolapillus sp. TaxID=2017437 RepID=UPI003AF5FD26
MPDISLADRAFLFLIAHQASVIFEMTDKLFNAFALPLPLKIPPCTAPVSF